MPLEEKTDEVQPQDESQPQEEGKRERSTIQFPYLPLDDAVAIAKGVHAVGGTSCQIDQLAGHLKQSPGSSMFKLRLSTARIFGLVTISHGTVSLTPLGTRINDPQQEQGAKADAFLTVPLYKQVYEQFKGNVLPPASGLETTMGNLGVAPKQKSNARQVFHRAATQAGFFAFGPTRLVYPPIKGSAGAAPAVDPNPAILEGDREQEKPDRGKGNGGDDGGMGGYHPFIAGLLKTLPPADSDWPMDARRKWLQAASTIFEVIYKDSDSKGSLRIEVQKDSAK
jgi:hypothetical protein